MSNVDAEKELAALRERVATLEARNSELSDEVNSAGSMLAAAQTDAREAAKYQQLADESEKAAMARAEAAERELREVTAAKDRAVEAYKQAEHARLDADGARQAAERRVRELEAHLKDVRRILTAADHESTEGAVMRLVSRAGVRPKSTTTLDNGWTPTTHPAPAGLLEEVGTLVKAVLDTRQHGDGSSLFLARDSEPGPEVLSAESLERLCAAFDAAKGGEAREEGSLTDLLTLLARPETDTLLRVDTEGERLFSVDGAELHEMAEKARKWAAAVQMARNREAIARAIHQQVQALIDHSSWEDTSRADQEDYLDAADAVLAMLGLDTPPSGPVDDNAKCEDCKHPVEIHFASGCEKCGCGAPPSGPGGGVKCPSCEGRGYPGEIGCGRGGQGSCPACKGTGRDADDVQVEEVRPVERTVTVYEPA